MTLMMDTFSGFPGAFVHHDSNDGHFFAIPPVFLSVMIVMTRQIKSRKMCDKVLPLAGQACRIRPAQLSAHMGWRGLRAI